MQNISLGLELILLKFLGLLSWNKTWHIVQNLLSQHSWNQSILFLQTNDCCERTFSKILPFHHLRILYFEIYIKNCLSSVVIFVLTTALQLKSCRHPIVECELDLFGLTISALEIKLNYYSIVLSSFVPQHFSFIVKVFYAYWMTKINIRSFGCSWLQRSSG